MNEKELEKQIKVRNEFDAHMKKTNPKKWAELDEQRKKQFEMMVNGKIESDENANMFTHVSMLKTADFLGKMFYMLINRKLNENGFGDMQAENIWLLMFVSDFNDFTLSELARFTNQSRANITMATKKLEANGYVERYQKAENKKAIFIKTTPKWEEVSAIIYKTYSSINENIYQKLGKEKVDQLTIDLFNVGEILKDLF
jgi:DNA-binding MarR family transcriptional regulator